MSEHEERELAFKTYHLLRELIHLMADNNTALADLNTSVTGLQTDVASVQAAVAALVAAIPSGSAADISAGVAAASTAIATAAANLEAVAAEAKAATPAPVTVPALSVPDQTLSAGLGANVSYQITHVGGVGTVTFQPVVGLPDGLTNDATGVVTGVVTTSGTFGPFTVNVSDQGTPTNTAVGNLTVTVA